MTSSGPPAIVLIIAIGVLFAGGIYLMLERSLTRILLGFILVSQGANLLLLVAGGHAGQAPMAGSAPEPLMADPLVQAMILTSIVITLALTAFVVALAYRSWQLEGHDEVPDDVEDQRVAKRAAEDTPADGEDADGEDADGEDADEADEDTGRLDNPAAGGQA